MHLFSIGKLFILFGALLSFDSKSRVPLNHSSALCSSSAELAAIYFSENLQGVGSVDSVDETEFLGTSETPRFGFLEMHLVTVKMFSTEPRSLIYKVWADASENCLVRSVRQE